MRHLLSYSIYQDLSFLGADPRVGLDSIRCDNLEVLTGYEVPDPIYKDFAETVHLPYAPVWLEAWDGDPVDMSDDYALFFMYGRSRAEVVENVRRAIECATHLDPAHGVFHASVADIEDVFHRTQSRSDTSVLGAVCELMNEVMAGEEPPFTIAFENLWWPGLRLLDPSDHRFMSDHLEFDDWSYCLDTGHMMSCLPTVDESDCIERLERVFGSYPQDLLDRISAVHLHWSATYAYRSTFPERDFDGKVEEFLRDANVHVSKMDNHLPFSDPRCTELVDMLQPEYVIHEMLGSENGVVHDFVKQRSHFV